MTAPTVEEVVEFDDLEELDEACSVIYYDDEQPGDHCDNPAIYHRISVCPENHIRTSALCERHGTVESFCRQCAPLAWVFLTTLYQVRFR